MTPKLIQLYQEMSDLTAPECAKSCLIPHSCCSLEYCMFALETALEDGVQLPTTGHKTLPLMGENGCTCPPHYRPMCTLHTCDINNLGFKRNDPEWTTRYFRLRKKISKTHYEAENETDR